MIEPPSLGPAWADLVFHILAHVRPAQALPSSLFDEMYIAFAARHAGPPSNRALAADASTLARVATSHESLARLQWVARLFDNPVSARAVASRDLSELGDHDVADAAALHALSGLWDAAEVLRAAAELEAPHHAKLPHIAIEPELAAELERVSEAAPWLHRLRVECLRALRLRGRLFEAKIWVGVPSPELSVSAEHIAVQAGHEATVAEVGDAARAQGKRLGERDVEHAALMLFAERAARSGIAGAHASWWAELTSRRVPG